MLKAHTLTLTSLTLVLLSANAIADTSGRIQFAGAGATSNIGILSGDAMLPLIHQENGFIYGDMMGAQGSDSTNTISPGIGFRTLHNNQIFGSYFFADYEKTSLGEHFWNLSPGVEWITPQWDAHMNAYFPTHKAQQNGTTAFADTFGIDDYTAYEANTNNEYNELLTPYAVIGNGVDTEIGYSFDSGNEHLRSRVYLGGYYYQVPDYVDVENITGVTAGVSQAVSRYASVSLFNSFDQVTHYTFGISLTITFGGESNIFSNDVHDRLVDPVERHVGVIGTGAANYDQAGYQEQGMALEYDNVHFAAPVAQGNGDGTYTNAMALTQDNLDAIEGDARIYVQGGSDATYSNTSELDVSDGLDFYGRSENYKEAASSDERPNILFDDNGFVTQGGENTFSDLIITSSNSGNGIGITASTVGDDDASLTITNTSISGFSTGAQVTNNGAGTFTLSTNNSSFNNNTAEGSGAQATGLTLINGGDGAISASLNNSQFNNNSTDGTDQPITAGLYAENSGTGDINITARNSQFNNNTSNYIALGAELVNSGAGNMTMQASNSQFNNNTADTLSAGLYATNLETGYLTINTYYSKFNDNTAEYGYGMFVHNDNAGQVSINNEHIRASGNSTTNIDINN